VEYATREQAQQAVNTLSNQNLMGRLVYVREVSLTCIQWSLGLRLMECARIARPNLVLQALQREAAADSMVAHVAALVATLEHHQWVAEAAVVRSMLTTFVS
jgi:hypothetical protein